MDVMSSHNSVVFRRNGTIETGLNYVTWAFFLAGKAKVVYQVRVSWAFPS